MDRDEFLSKTVRRTAEVAEYTGLTEAMVRKLLDDERVHATRHGRVWFASTRSVLAYLDGPGASGNIDPTHLVNHVLATVRRTTPTDDRQIGLGVDATERWLLIREDSDGAWWSEHVPRRDRGFYLFESQQDPGCWIFGAQTDEHTHDMYVTRSAARVLAAGADHLGIVLNRVID